ncbi:MAG: AbrB/MazE/SpoVT family DNA-binding domain-containing protein, partial [Deltaproteobacteria bacterium]|nr:AbrB/MazE/SpoVT family DNA-binding domain-containing protein [Deltaproteobacteria bacterium]
MAKQNILQADEKGRITLPPEVRKKSEGLFAYEVDPHGVIKLKPVVGLVTSDQAYFWSRRWQKGEEQA